MAEIAAKRVDGLKAIDTSAICYGYEPDDDGLGGGWFIYFPGFGSGMLSNHHITENNDGTITAYPSIVMYAGAGKKRHGWLRDGIFETCTDEVL